MTTPAHWTPTDLDEFARHLGARVDTRRESHCWRRLHQRRHKCSHDYVEPESFWHIDHPVWLRWPDGTWALLSQTYNPSSDIEGLAVVRDVTVRNIGAAPYGYGTTALLLVGTDPPSSLIPIDPAGPVG